MINDAIIICDMKICMVFIKIQPLKYLTLLMCINTCSLHSNKHEDNKECSHFKRIEIILMTP